MKRWFFLATLALSFTSAIAEPSVHVKADVVFASTAKGTVEPQLEDMKNHLKKKISYETLKLVSSESIDVSKKESALKLPNDKKVTFVLESLKGGVATVLVTVPPTTAHYQLGRKGTLYIQAGPHDGGDLFLALSSVK